MFEGEDGKEGEKEGGRGEIAEVGGGSLVCKPMGLESVFTEM